MQPHRPEALQGAGGGFAKAAGGTAQDFGAHVVRLNLVDALTLGGKLGRPTDGALRLPHSSWPRRSYATRFPPDA